MSFKHELGQVVTGPRAPLPTVPGNRWTPGA